jgi:hypothetical protein
MNIELPNVCYMDFEAFGRGTPADVRGSVFRDQPLDVVKRWVVLTNVPCTPQVLWIYDTCWNEGGDLIAILMLSR